ncbi:PD-(D/E)XK family protein, DUF4420 [Erythrobacter litoralis]|uniref:PD-(D/E)XK motif protein n=1 Tax=Erythrobacter litoralis TaxID=39960 RepID=A0A074M9E7_9SPHN|nr:PD-(D/E)XK motif protein [Erythrobacter litoralis]AOL22593.1 PD-(D/E)XK family protein, DUF4420 [Erythrobacter litoralis]KEO90039.1 hypothetical protein EH32_03365 [Erythrobacter litoralis]
MSGVTALLDWSQVAADLTGSGPITYQLDPGSQLVLSVDPKRDMMVLNVVLHPNDPTPELAKFKFVMVQRVTHGGKQYLRLEVDDKDLFVEFFNFSKTVADNVVDGASAYAALLDTIGSFNRLFSSEGSITEESRVGLIGELWVLKQLIDEFGEDAVKCWMGPKKDAHDYRFDDAELEVKTTRSAGREHKISRIDQLQESPGKKLFLLSIQLVETPNDKSLAVTTLVSIIRGHLGDQSLLQTFNEKLAKWLPKEIEDGVDEGSPLYQLRSEPALMEVNDSFPRLIPKSLELLSAHQKDGRITGLEYSIDVTGMGSPVSDGKIHAKLK